MEGGILADRIAEESNVEDCHVGGRLGLAARAGGCGWSGTVGGIVLCWVRTGVSYIGTIVVWSS